MRKIEFQMEHMLPTTKKGSQNVQWRSKSKIKDGQGARGFRFAWAKRTNAISTQLSVKTKS